jgi:hypothetical protein
MTLMPWFIVLFSNCACDENVDGNIKKLVLCFWSFILECYCGVIWALMLEFSRDRFFVTLRKDIFYCKFFGFMMDM